MILSNFRNYESKRSRSGYTTTEYADVDVTTGSWFWKKTVTRQIVKTTIYWFFVDNGEWTPGHQAEELCRAYLAQKNLL